MPVTCTADAAASLATELARAQDASLSAFDRSRAAHACGDALRAAPRLDLVRQVLDVAIGLAAEVDVPHARQWTPPVGELLDAVLAVLRPAGGGAPAPLADADLLDEAPLRTLIVHPWPVPSRQGIRIAALLPGTRDEETAREAARYALAGAHRKGEVAEYETEAVEELLATCPPIPEVLTALRALCESPLPVTRTRAVVTLSLVGGEPAARALWEEWADSRSAPRRGLAAWLATQHGDARDVDLVLRALDARLRARGFPVALLFDWTILVAFLRRVGAVERARPVLERGRAHGAHVDPEDEIWLREHAPELALPG